MKILFLHGWTSVPGGLKPTYLAQHGHEVLNPKLPEDNFEGAVRIAQVEFDEHKPDVVVGSSRGGAVALNIEIGNTPLVLLCSAWKHWGAAKKVKPGTAILHSRADDVIPFAASEELVRNSGLPATGLIEVGNDHRLADQESLERLREACEQRQKVRVVQSVHHSLPISEHPMSKPEHVDLSKLRPGPIRNESLSLALLDQIKAVFDVIGPYIGMTLEQFEIGFMRDMHPENEVALWFRITKAWLAYHEDYLGNETLPNEDEGKLVGALIAISTGVEDVAKLGVPVEVGRRLVQCYDDPAGSS